MSIMKFLKKTKLVLISTLVIVAVTIIILIVQDVFKKFTARNSKIKDATSSQQASLSSDGCDPNSTKTSSFINEKGNYVVSSTSTDDKGNTITYTTEYDSNNNVISKTKTVKNKDDKAATYEWIDNLYGESKGGYKLKD